MDDICEVDCFQIFETGMDTNTPIDDELEQESSAVNCCPGSAQAAPTSNNLSHDSDHTASRPNLPSVPLPSDEVNIARGYAVLKRLKKYMTRNVFLSILTLYGKSRYTLAAYDHHVVMMKDRREGRPLPSSSTMRHRVLPYLLSNIFVPSTIRSFKVKDGHASSISRANGISSTTSVSKHSSECVVVLPSQWAQYDVRCIHTLRELSCINGCRCHPQQGSSDVRIESSNVIQQRHKISQHSNCLFVNFNGHPVPATAGCSITLNSPCDDYVPELRRIVRFRSASFRREVCVASDATIISSFHVAHSHSRGLHLQDGIPLRP